MGNAMLYCLDSKWDPSLSMMHCSLNCSFSWGVREERLQPGEAKVGETEACRPSEREREAKEEEEVDCGGGVVGGGGVWLCSPFGW